MENKKIMHWLLSLLPAIYWVKTNYKANLTSRGWASVIVPCAYKQKNWNICDYLWWLRQRKENCILIGRCGRELQGGGDGWVRSLLMSIILASEIEVTWWHSHIIGNNSKFETKVPNTVSPLCGLPVFQHGIIIKRIISPM